MTRFSSPVKRFGAENYLLITLVSFACTVVLVRLFLQLTGYPQIGGSVLHIAHLLWGGLLLFVGALLPIIFANRWVYTLGALASGIGVGLFIDEVGKFITQTNDYFFPFAAPLIYAFFLLTVLLYLQVRRPSRPDSRSELYHALDQMMELIENDLDESEHADLERRLYRVIANPATPEHARLAEALLAVLNSDTLTLVEPPPNTLQIILKRLETLEKRLLSERRHRFLLVLGLAVAGVGALIDLLLLGGALLSRDFLNELVRILLFSRESVTDPNTVLWSLVLIIVSGITGVLKIVGGFLLFIGRARLGSEIGLLALLVSLTTVDLLLFYFSQFAAVGTTFWEFVVLVALVRYRHLYLGVGANMNALTQLAEKRMAAVE